MLHSVVTFAPSVGCLSEEVKEPDGHPSMLAESAVEEVAPRLAASCSKGHVLSRSEGCSVIQLYLRVQAFLSVSYSVERCCQSFLNKTRLWSEKDPW